MQEVAFESFSIFIGRTYYNLTYKTSRLCDRHFTFARFVSNRFAATTDNLVF